MKNALLLFLVIHLLGCGLAPKAKVEPESDSEIKEEQLPDTGVSQIHTSVEYVGTNNAKLNQSLYPKDIVLAFPYVSGGLLGSPNSPKLSVEKRDKSKRFFLQLSNKAAQIESNATALKQEWIQLGLKAEPKETVVAKLGVLPYGEKDKLLLGSGGFIDPKSRNSLMLVYVDRESEISGNIQFNGEYFSHDLSFPDKGFYWVEITKKSKGQFVLKRYYKQNAIFSIHI